MVVSHLLIQKPLDVVQLGVGPGLLDLARFRVRLVYLDCLDLGLIVLSLVLQLDSGRGRTY